MVNDLPVAEASYHHICSTNFRTGNKISSEYPQMDDGTGLKRQKRQKLSGRSKSASKYSAFSIAIQYLEENDNETITLEDLHDVMKTQSGLSNDKLYTTVQLRNQRIKYYGEKVMITTIHKSPNIVTPYIKCK